MKTYRIAIQGTAEVEAENEEDALVAWADLDLEDWCDDLKMEVVPEAAIEAA